MKDNFSTQSKAYASFRPRFPDELYQFILSHVSSYELAWDVATGNGQSAVKLAPFFKEVIATDISESQLAHAEQLPNISYRKEPAEKSSLESNSCDLITISQALHWFDFEKFYTEVRRVAKHGTVIAAFSYSMFRAENKKLDELIQVFYADSAPYWDNERKYIDEEYKTLPFPFDEITAPGFNIQYEWTLDQVLGYFETWSANQHYIKKTGESLVSQDFKNQLLQYLRNDEMIRLRFPVYMRIGKI